MNQGGIGNAVLGGWAMNWIVTLQGGQPLNFRLPHRDDLRNQLQRFLVPGQSQKLGCHTRLKAEPLSLVWKSRSLQQPCELGVNPTTLQPDASLLRTVPPLWAA